MRLGKSNRELKAHILRSRPFNNGVDRPRWGAIVADREPLVKNLLCYVKRRQSALAERRVTASRTVVIGCGPMIESAALFLGRAVLKGWNG